MSENKTWPKVYTLKVLHFSRFGWFGLKPEIPNDTTLNYIAIGFAMTR